MYTFTQIYIYQIHERLQTATAKLQTKHSLILFNAITTRRTLNPNTPLLNLCITKRKPSLEQGGFHAEMLLFTFKEVHTEDALSEHTSTDAEEKSVRLEDERPKLMPLVVRLIMHY